jgi:hypothetical protein
MPRPDADFYPEPASASALREQLAKTPWWMLSVGFHAVVVMLAYLVMFDSAPTTRPQDIVVTVAEAPEDPWKEEKVPPETDFDRDLPPAEIEHNNPDLSEDTAEPDLDQNAEDVASGDPENASDRSMDARWSNVAIGVGPGAPGRWGKNGFGGRFTVGTGGPPGGGVKRKNVDAGIAWLARHQAPDGSWSCDNFQACCKKNVCDGRGASADHTPGTSALAVLAFLGAGHTHRHGAYREVMKRAVRYLQSIQTPDGCVGAKTGDGHYLYNHAIATMALAEAYGMTSTPGLRKPAQDAVDFLVGAQNPYLGWRYGIRPGDNDTSVTGWAVLALKSALLADLNVPAEAFTGARQWLDKATDDSFYKTGYTQKGDNGARLPEAARYRPTEAMTAAALASRIFMGAKADDPAVRGAVSLLVNQVPAWEPDSGNDFYYWYYGTLGMFQVGGEPWGRWERGLEAALLKTQRRGGDEEGSWDPCDAWGHAGGRVYATALNVLTLEVYYRYSKVLKGK